MKARGGALAVILSTIACGGCAPEIWSDTHHETIQVVIENRCSGGVRFGLGFDEVEAIEALSDARSTISPGEFGGDIIPVVDSDARLVFVALLESGDTSAQVSQFIVDVLRSEPGRLTACEDFSS